MNSSPTLSDHPLIKLQIFAATTINVFTFPLTKGHFSNVATISWQIG